MDRSLKSVTAKELMETKFPPDADRTPREILEVTEVEFIRMLFPRPMADRIIRQRRIPNERIIRYRR
ncbi:MAG: hypothetical protein OXC79_10770 [Candidatus Poribacteria bacterium]|nr:hypothetical protein [Candidatus Poribacteria bacterium]